MKIGNNHLLNPKRWGFLNRPEAKKETASTSPHVVDHFAASEPSTARKVFGTVAKVAAGALGSAAIGAGLAAAGGVIGAVAGAAVLTYATGYAAFTVGVAAMDLAGSDAGVKLPLGLGVAGMGAGLIGGIAMGGTALPVLGVAAGFAAVGGAVGAAASYIYR